MVTARPNQGISFDFDEVEHLRLNHLRKGLARRGDLRWPDL